MPLIAPASASRRIAVPLWALGVVLAWGVGVAAVGLLEARAGIEASQLCLFRRVTGVPCATCGSTRAVFAACEGRFVDAFLLNPLVCAGVVGGGVWFLMRLALARHVDLRLTRAHVRSGWVALAVLFLMNWVWVVLRG